MFFYLLIHSLTLFSCSGIDNDFLVFVLNAQQIVTLPISRLHRIVVLQKKLNEMLWIAIKGILTELLRHTICANERS